MVDEHPTTPDREPQPGDTVFLHAGTLAGISPRTPLVVADAEHGVYELNHQDHHPDHQDWAAAVEIEHIATVVRISLDGVTSSWAPAS
jgi:hypothetical protein